MTRIAWPVRSVRPYESLLILLARFLWLNRPEASELADSLELPMNGLARLNLVFRRFGGRRVELTWLREALEMDVLQWSHAVLDWNTLGDSTISDMRFCPQCLEQAYHTAIFQLHTITICPEHRCELICGCPGCATKMPTFLTGDLLCKPLTCARCKRVLIRPGVLIDPPSIGPVPEIARIADWYRWASEMPRIETLPRAEKGRGKEFVYSPLWPLVELAGENRAPELVSVEREQLAGAMTRVIACGLPLSKKPPLPENQEPVPPYENEIRVFTLYKQYRRHLKKRMSGGERRQVGDFLRLYVDRWDDSLKIPTGEASQEARARAFALLLFRFTMEGWSSLYPGICPRAPSILEGCNGLVALQETHSLSAHRTDSFRCSTAESEWLEDHLVLEGIRSIFEDALRFAREMVRTGYYFLVDICHFQRLHFPFCLGKRGGKGQLELWSVKLATDLDDYRRAQEIWMSSPTARILYKESPPEVENRDQATLTRCQSAPPRAAMAESVTCLPGDKPGYQPVAERFIE